MATINGQRIDLEIQVNDEGDYRERTLYYASRELSDALPSGGDCKKLPCVVIISIMRFSLFEDPEYHSDYVLMERNRHTLFGEHLNLFFFELTKLSNP